MKLFKLFCKKRCSCCAPAAGPADGAVDIHPTALVSPHAKLGKGVKIGPYCVVGEHVSIGDGTTLQSHVVIQGHTTIGVRNIIYPFASLGQPSPDRKYKGELATLEIGDENDIREYVNIHIGTGEDKGVTKVGNRNLLMAMVHVAHDCVVGDDCILANGTQLAGHVELENNVVIGGLTGLHQHIRVGAHSIIGGHTGVDKDVPPYGNVSGRRARLSGLNLIGLRRSGMENEDIRALQAAFETLFFQEEDHSLAERLALLEEGEQASNHEKITHLIDFTKQSTRGMTMPELDDAPKPKEGKKH